MILNLLLLVVLPVAAGLAALAVKGEKIKKISAVAVFSLGAAVSLVSLFTGPGLLAVALLEGFALVLGTNIIAGYIMVFINLFGLMVALYSGTYEKDDKSFLPFVLMLIGFANLTVLAADFILFAFAWGSMLVLLYALLNPGSPATARKAVSVVGAADFMLIGGIALFAAISGTTLMPEAGRGIAIGSPLALTAFVLMFAGAIGKAGAWPFHTWIPDASQTSTVTVMAVLPASLDKLLGIYLLARVCADFFTLNSAAMGIMLVTGAFTVLFAVLMALVQKDARKLLAYHAVSQVGYMVMGFGTGLAVGFAAGLFHMLNNAIYKTGLFLSAGAAGREKGTFDIGKMGGLARHMPVTFVCALIFSLSISGVPPLNGFYSKWMVYQGVISGLFAYQAQWLRAVLLLALVSAMFGSALTLASFVKFLHSVFLGQESSPGAGSPKEAPMGMRLPLVVMAGLCVILGVFPRLFLSTAAEWLPGALETSGEWNAPAAFLLMLLGLLGGVLFVFRKLMRGKLRVSGAYFGGQEDDADMNFPATEFYKTVQELSAVSRFYRVMNAGAADLYNSLTSLLRGAGAVLYYGVDRVINLLTAGAGAGVLGLSRLLRKLHTGSLDLYIIWCLFAMAALFFIIAR